MSLTKESEDLIRFFSKSNCIPFTHLQSKTKNIFKKLFKEIHKNSSNISTLSKELNTFRTIETIENLMDIPRPLKSNFQSLPPEVVERIYEESIVKVSYGFSLHERNIKVTFIDEEFLQGKYDKYIYRILTWMNFVLPYSKKNCSKELSIFIYLTGLKKRLPISSLQVLDQIHVNTAYTFTCSVNNEIIIFRQEEWFKVLIHETFHNLGLDFADMDNSACHQVILSIFPIQSQVNLCESYTECWAKILNIVFCTYFSLHLERKGILEEFLSTIEKTMYMEQCFSYFQMVKTLRFMGLTYQDLFSNDVERKTLRESLYREKTNVFAYYIITTLLLANYQSFMNWCDFTQISLLAFKKEAKHQKKFCEFIYKLHDQPMLLKKIHCVEEEVSKMRNYKGKDKQFVLSTMRMSICEII